MTLGDAIVIGLFTAAACILAHWLVQGPPPDEPPRDSQGGGDIAT